MSISKKRLAEISALPDNEIDYSDIPELDETFWKNAVLEMPENKDCVTISIDHDVLAWLKSQNSGYQIAINQILRQYMNKHISQVP